MTTMPTDRPVLRLTTHENVLEAVPYLLGFTPEASLVVLGLGGERNRLSVFYGDAPVGDLALALRQKAAEADIRVREMLHVSNGRFFSLLCDNDACCPPDGRPLPTAVTQVSATATAAGLAPFATREDVTARLAGDDDQHERVGMVFARLVANEGLPLNAYSDEHLARLRLLVDRYRIERTPRLEELEAANAALFLHNINVRDRVFIWTLDGDDVQRALQTLLTDVVRMVGRWESVPAATLLAATSYVLGEGAFANVAVDHALRFDPNYSLARLIDTALRQGLHPTQFLRVIEQTRNELDAREN
jgi:hypothetical protein